MIVQFTIEGTQSRHTFRIKSGVYYDNNDVITKERYEQALQYHNTERSKK